jgi:hypothetical protein
MAGLRMRLFRISILIPTRMSAVTPSRRIDRVRQGPGMGQGPTKSPIVCLASDSRHWGLKTLGKFPCSRPINGDLDDALAIRPPRPTAIRSTSLVARAPVPLGALSAARSLSGVHRYGRIFLGWLANAASHPAAPGPFSTLFYLPNRSASRAPAPKSNPTAGSQKSRRGAQT